MLTVIFYKKSATLIQGGAQAIIVSHKYSVRYLMLMRVVVGGWRERKRKRTSTGRKTCPKQGSGSWKKNVLVSGAYLNLSSVVSVNIELI